MEKNIFVDDFELSDVVVVFVDSKIVVDWLVGLSKE